MLLGALTLERRGECRRPRRLRRGARGKGNRNQDDGYRSLHPTSPLDIRCERRAGTALPEGDDAAQHVTRGGAKPRHRASGCCPPPPPDPPPAPPPPPSDPP